ncbi:hypothetical protein AJ78_02298 [Emergomyces pasteurianus Ep9510]|uniref:superoxide dismutase n=1 Tax=Emergomyces pasteurianus Ep9510 TaxID=1447872 RepID=A0A1J9QN49_9EURO|nr:hypothetical protein AJ78_02298 [Emergomyces pasteurianus Ep9510]
MRSAFALLAYSAAGIGLSMAQDYPIALKTTGNPDGVVYSAMLLDKNTTTVRGYVNATAGPGGEGVVFVVDVWGFPNETLYGPFPYHIHDQPVSSDGNCSSTLDHLDPTVRYGTPPCDPTKPETCQVGDLSGKYGDVMNASNGSHYNKTYYDPFTSTKHGPASFFGNRSIVFHYNNGSRINCGNFTLVKSTMNPTPTGGQPKPSSHPPGEGGAARIGALSISVVLGSVAALLW